MAYEQRDNSGSLFRNDRREKETHPQAKGDALIDGVEYWVSAWTKEGKNGKFQSLSFTRKDERRDSQPPARTSSQTPKQQSYAEASGGRGGDFLDDNIPFAPEWR